MASSIIKQVELTHTFALHRIHILLPSTVGLVFGLAGHVWSGSQPRHRHMLDTSEKMLHSCLFFPLWYLLLPEIQPMFAWTCKKKQCFWFMQISVNYDVWYVHGHNVIEVGAACNYNVFLFHTRNINCSSFQNSCSGHIDVNSVSILCTFMIWTFKWTDNLFHIKTNKNRSVRKHRIM